MYSEKYLRHFQSPQNIGTVLEPDGSAEVQHQSEGCFDRVAMTLRVENGKIVELKYKVRACSGTIAACSALTALTIGKTINEAEKIQQSELIEELGGIPERKIHSIELALKVLQETLANYRNRKAK
jgi:NifU-like protein involved in Fe-S cluster formation